VYRTPAFPGSCFYEENDQALRGGGIEHVHVFNKFGTKVIGHDSGPVRSPLTGLTLDEVEELAALVSRLKASEFTSRCVAGESLVGWP